MVFRYGEVQMQAWMQNGGYCFGDPSQEIGAEYAHYHRSRLAGGARCLSFLADTKSNKSMLSLCFAMCVTFIFQVLYQVN